jgi:hypothetical protein
MINYGISKLFMQQFRPPSPEKLVEAYGSASPMGLAWTFFGFSEGYNWFMGLAELASGLFLLFRRTNRMGVVFTLLVSLNVAAVNYCFDVCVKLLSTVMVIMSLFLFFQDKQHAAYFIFNRSVSSDDTVQPWARSVWHFPFRLAKYILITFIVYWNIANSVDLSKRFGVRAPKPALYGVYDVQVFVRNRDTLAPLTTDTVRWRKLMLSNFKRSEVRLMNDSTRPYSYTLDTVKKTLSLYVKTDTAKKSMLAYSIIGKDSLLLSGVWFNDSVTMMLKKYDDANFLLINHGFHFIHEAPFNK